MMKTMLRHWYEDENGIYTCDEWEIPETGTEIWCSAWKRAQTIHPYGDGCHVIVGITCFHCDEFIGILKRLETEGYSWGIDGVVLKRRQRKGPYWEYVSL